MNKIYGYFINGVLKKISFNKELLQEILMDDYYDDAYYQFNVLTLQPWNYHGEHPMTPLFFWQDVKSKNSKYSSRLSYRVIKDMEEYYVE